MVDEVEVSSPLDTLVICGKATRSGSWEGDTLATIVHRTAS